MATPLVSIGITIWNGESFIAETLDSLLAQDYENFEIVILDNLSTDNTSSICTGYAQKDKRIRYVLDSERRNVIEGQRRVFGYARGEYFMIACDDDVYAPTYVSKLMTLMNADPSVGLAYSSYAYISPDGMRVPANFKRKYLLTRRNSRRQNFMHYLLHRNPIPIVFGLIRANVHKDALPYYRRVDERRWDHDNLYLLRLFSLTRVDSTDEVLFFYRQRDREKLYRDRGQLAPSSSKWQDYVEDLLHQVRLTGVVREIIDNAPFSYLERKFLRLYAVSILLLNFKRLTRRLIPIRFRGLRGARRRTT
jgi:glycosyltransferase involved in cell wall biosynthesis